MLLSPILATILLLLSTQPVQAATNPNPPYSNPNISSAFIPSKACTHYVATTGNDANTGTNQQSPWRTLQASINKLASGNVLCVAAGKYIGNIAINNPGITIRGQDPQNRPTITGDSNDNDDKFDYPSGTPQNSPPSSDRQQCQESTSFGGTGQWNVLPYPQTCFVYQPLVAIQADNVIFEGFVVTRSRGRGIRIWKSDTDPIKGVTINGNIVDFNNMASIIGINSQDLLIVNNEVSRGASFARFRRNPSLLNHPGSGIVTRQGTYTRVLNNVLHEGWGEVLIFDANDGGSQYVTIRDNVIYDNYATTSFHGVRHVVLENNIFYTSQPRPTDGLISHTLVMTPTESLYMKPINTENVTIHNNLFLGTYGGTINFWLGPADARKVKDVTISNNTIVSDDAAVIYIDNLPNRRENIQFKNNIIYQFKANGLLGQGAGELIQFVNNCWNRDPGNNWRSSSDIINCNPAFKGFQNGAMPTLSRGINPNTIIEWYTPTNSNLGNIGARLEPEEYQTSLQWDLNDSGKVDILDFNFFTIGYITSYSFIDLISFISALH